MRASLLAIVMVALSAMAAPLIAPKAVAVRSTDVDDSIEYPDFKLSDDDAIEYPDFDRDSEIEYPDAYIDD